MDLLLIMLLMQNDAPHSPVALELEKVRQEYFFFIFAHYNMKYIALPLCIMKLVGSVL